MKEFKEGQDGWSIVSEVEREMTIDTEEVGKCHILLWLETPWETVWI